MRIMGELIHEFSSHVKDDRGNRYTATAYGTERLGGTWIGWLEFSPADHDGPVLKTESETSQPNRIALQYWASGLEPIYLDGAFARAQGETAVIVEAICGAPGRWGASLCTLQGLAALGSRNCRSYSNRRGLFGITISCCHHMNHRAADKRLFVPCLTTDAQSDAQVVDVFLAFACRGEHLSTDCIHPSGAGYQAIATLAGAALLTAP